MDRPRARMRSLSTMTWAHLSSNSEPSCSSSSFLLTRQANSRSGYVASCIQYFYTHTHTHTHTREAICTHIKNTELMQLHNSFTADKSECLYHSAMAPAIASVHLDISVTHWLTKVNILKLLPPVNSFSNNCKQAKLVTTFKRKLQSELFYLAYHKTV